MNITLANSLPYKITIFCLQLYIDECLRISAISLFITMNLNKTDLFGEMVLEVLSHENIFICYIMYIFSRVAVIHYENYSRTEHHFSQHMDITSNIHLKLKILTFNHFKIFR
jgi:hypothetical protein